VLLQDWAPTQQFIDELTRSLLLAGIAAFALSLAGGWSSAAAPAGP
jgi:hypothetical protein